ncbi:isocitrate lyase/PEP mutase family protein [Kribbella sp. CA-245084]|uniref:isocitrate lyase/PEP mutase family protein n=1 Tax=Kribbella sp. CA-245084 TaxID=3239940 RepID=UPI003D932494
MTELQQQCELLRSLHRPGNPLLLPNAWDAATARAVVAAGYPVVATTSWGVAAALGYEDDEGAPGDEMLAAAGRIVRAVDVPVSVDAEAGYRMEPAELVAALHAVGAAGCNLEDSDHSTGGIHDTAVHAEWLAAIRASAAAIDYPLVINARIDVFVPPFLAGAGMEAYRELVPAATDRAKAYLDVGVDCVYPIGPWESDALGQFVSDVQGPVNVTHWPERQSSAELAELGVARVSWAIFLYEDAMARFADDLGTIQG